MFRFVTDGPAAVEISARCLAGSTGAAAGHTHELFLGHVERDISVAPGTSTHRVSCGDFAADAKGITATYSFDERLYLAGHEPMPINRDFTFSTRPRGALPAQVDLVCLRVRTGPAKRHPKTFTNTAFVRPGLEIDPNLANNSGSASAEVQRRPVPRSPRPPDPAPAPLAPGPAPPAGSGARRGQRVPRARACRRHPARDREARLRRSARDSATRPRSARPTRATRPWSLTLACAERRDLQRPDRRLLGAEDEGQEGQAKALKVAGGSFELGGGEGGEVAVPLTKKGRKDKRWRKAGQVTVEASFSSDGQRLALSQKLSLSS